MDRRVSGGLILVMALLVALVVPKVLNPPRVDGLAAVAPPPPPPVVGDCIAEDVWSYGVTTTGFLTSAQRITLVACDQPHRNEIYLLEPELAASFDPQNPMAAVDAFANRCAEHVADIQPAGRSAAGGWQQRIDLSISVIGPDRRQIDGGQRWGACVVGVAHSELTQRLSDLNGADIRPEFGQCTLTGTGTGGFTISLSCDEPHDGEYFAFQNLERSSTTTRDDLDSSCRQLVAAETRRPGLLSDSSLAVETDVTVYYEGERPPTDALPLPADAAGGWATCSVRTTGDRELTGSLRQLGDGPLPWA